MGARISYDDQGRNMYRDRLCSGLQGQGVERNSVDGNFFLSPLTSLAWHGSLFGFLRLWVRRVEKASLS